MPRKRRVDSVAAAVEIYFVAEGASCSADDQAAQALREGIATLPWQGRRREP